MLHSSSLCFNKNYRTCSAIQNDSLGCNSVSWAPFSALGSLLENGRSIKRLVTGSCDNMVRIWRQQEQGASWEEERTTLMHTGKLIKVDVKKCFRCCLFQWIVLRDWCLPFHLLIYRLGPRCRMGSEYGHALQHYCKLFWRSYCGHMEADRQGWPVGAISHEELWLTCVEGQLVYHRQCSGGLHWRP